MKTVFEPSNALEGHMLEDLLRQRGISARVEGAQLQGGVGELPVSGFVRLVVDDSDYVAARAVIDEWEAANVSEPIPVPPDRTTGKFLAGLIGLAIGIVATYAFLRAPASSEQNDNNEDGKLDEFLAFSPTGALLKIEIDRNYDGNIDLVQRIDREGQTDTVAADEDFDGDFETRLYYRANQPFLGEADTDRDSEIDFRTHFRYGVAASSEYLLSGSESPVRVDYYRLGKLVSAEADSDRDGRLDRRYRYSSLAEVIDTETIEVAD
ncbi:MAG: DUF2007 domain-containing protein [Steroidobacteraceae bacterium]